MKTLNDIYRFIGEPHLNYCCSAWGCSGITRIESLQNLQNMAARIVTGSSYDLDAKNVAGCPSEKNDCERDIYDDV